MKSVNNDGELWSNLDAERLANREEYSMVCWEVCCYHISCCFEI